MNRKYIVSLCLLFFSFVSFATNETAPVNWFLDNIYGRRPAAAENPEVRFSSICEDKKMMNGTALRKYVRITIKGTYGTLSFPVVAFLPLTAKPAPAFVLICNRSKENIDPERVAKSEFWPAEEIVSRGFAAIAFFNGDVAPDYDSGNTQGVFAIYEKPGKQRAMNAWGTLSAWAWGASRVMDWICTEPKIDAARVAIVGHSRGGKTALLSAVTDARFAMACSNNSGSSGARINKIVLPKAEHIADIVSRFSYWFCPNYIRYANRDLKIPHDQDEFLGLIAPRLLAIGSASDDAWAGPEGEFEAARRASVAWQSLGVEGLDGESFPEIGKAYQEGNISYHLRAGKHNLTLVDWNRYMDFAKSKGW